MVPPTIPPNNVCPVWNPFCLSLHRYFGPQDFYEVWNHCFSRKCSLNNRSGSKHGRTPSTWPCKLARCWEHRTSALLPPAFWYNEASTHHCFHRWGICTSSCKPASNAWKVGERRKLENMENWQSVWKANKAQIEPASSASSLLCPGMRRELPKYDEEVSLR